MKVFLLFLLILSCSTRPKTDLKSKLTKQGYRVVIGCMIFDLNGKILRSFPGSDCFFEDDGSLLIYDSEKLELSKFDKDMKKSWVLKIHTHHQIKKLSSGDYLVNTSDFKPFKSSKKVRFDEVIVVTKDGKITKRFSYYDYFLKQPWSKYVIPFETSWDQGLGNFKEVTHLASSYEVPFDIQKEGKVLFPKGSIIVTMNETITGITIIDPSFKFVIERIRVAHAATLHDGQFISPTQILFLKNTTYAHPITLSEQASVNIYDVVEKKIKKEIYLDLYALYTGGAQLVDKGLYFITDSNSGQKVTPSTFINENPSVSHKSKIHEQMKMRALIYHEPSNQVEQIHFDFNGQHAKLLKMDSFLKLNKGI